HRRVVDDELWIEVRPLAAQDRPVVEAARQRLDVPLADQRGVVAGIAQQHRPGDLVVAQAHLLVPARLLAAAGHAVAVRVQPRQVGGAAGRAHRGGDEALVEADALVADAVHVRRLQDLVAVDAQRVLRLVVGHDEDDVGRALGRLRRRLAGPGPGLGTGEAGCAQPQRARSQQLDGIATADVGAHAATSRRWLVRPTRNRRPGTTLAAH